MSESNSKTLSKYGNMKMGKFYFRMVELDYISFSIAGLMNLNKTSDLDELTQYLVLQKNGKLTSLNIKSPMGLSKALYLDDNLPALESIMTKESESIAGFVGYTETPSVIVSCYIEVQTEIREWWTPHLYQTNMIIIPLFGRLRLLVTIYDKTDKDFAKEQGFLVPPQVKKTSFKHLDNKLN